MSDAPHTLTPFEGVGPYRFGATPADCAALLGPPDRAWESRPLDEQYEQRGAAELAFSADGLVKVTCGAGAQLVAAGVDVFGDPAAADKLRAADPSATEHKQYLNLPTLGLCLGGFGKRKLKEGRLAIAYAPSQSLMISFLGQV
jgi:hypothetical protein